ncbi:hypothetical protein [Pseudomonas sp. 18175]|uniref:hypothetical protein n=1 Tax=Pseudomonas sp. 18175 TaxID=3390056 RepID=UPI003D1C92FA
MKRLLRPAAKRAVGSIVALGVVLGCLIPTAHAASCRLFLSQSVIDFGQLRSADRSASLGRRTVRLNVVCPENSTIALRFQADAADGRGYRFGSQGLFGLALLHPQLDGKPVELAQLYNPSERNGQMRPGQPLVVVAGGLPAKGRTFSAQVQVDTWLPSAATAVRDKTTLEGGGRFELVPAG